jgi:hypothetical protein
MVFGKLGPQDEYIGSWPVENQIHFPSWAIIKLYFYFKKTPSLDLTKVHS